MPMVGLGTWQLRGAKCTSAVRTALQVGYTLLDTAEAYDNQPDIARAIREEGVDREKLFITSKVSRSHLYYNGLLRACEKTLRELETDYLDLYLIHWPNDAIAMDETFEAMAKAQERGWVVDVGVSNFDIPHLEQALLVSKTPIAMDQIEFRPHYNQTVLTNFCHEHGIHVTAYSSLRYGEYKGEHTLREIASKHDKTAAQVVLRWLVGKGVVVIPRSTSRAHLLENLDVFDWQLDDEDIERIEVMDRIVA
ncbi:MAG: aldo/keto reductase [Chloroflexi bacterium]|nr:aldo/keto reductase [Chloroflexota bacterium]